MSQKSETDLQEVADKYYENNIYPEAKILFDSLLRLDSTNASNYHKRGYIKYYYYKDFTSSKSDLLKAIKYEYINSKSSYLTLGTIYMVEENYDSSMYCYNKALEIDSGYLKAINAKNELEILIKERRKVH